MNQQKKHRLTAALFALFGGIFGLHKFYLGKNMSGLFYLFLGFLFFRIRIPISIFLGFIDGIRLFRMSDEKFDQKYNGIYQTTEIQKSVRSQKGPKVMSSSGSKKEQFAIFKQRGFQKYKAFDLEEAIEDFESALEIDGKDAAIHFNLACAYSLTEKKSEGFEHLDAAVRFGFRDFAKILNHEDLAYLRIQPEFDQLRKNGFRLNAETSKIIQDSKSDDALLTQLNRLATLRKNGVITEMEFDEQRKKILRND